MELIQRIKTKQVKIGIMGLGYVGLPLVIEFCKKGFQINGFDVDNEKVELLKQGKSYIKHINSSLITHHSSLFTPTNDFSRLSEMDCVIICVPTPLNKYREPDMSYVFNTTKTIARYLRRGQLIVLESTTYPGTTDEDMRVILEESGLKAGEDFYLAFSPEREDPNNKDFSTSTIPKIVGGYTKKCLEIANTLYGQIVVKTVPVSSTRVAEAAKTKPFGFHAFYPGPGLGGHCIPIDPFYLTWKAREYDFSTRFIELAGEINAHMPYYVIQRVMEALNEQGKSMNGAKVLVLGVAYKKNVDDLRESPSLELIRILRDKGAKVDYHDPLIPVAISHRRGFKMHSTTLNKRTIGKYDCVLIATDHSSYDYKWIVENSQMVVDTRNATSGIKNNKIVKA